MEQSEVDHRLAITALAIEAGLIVGRLGRTIGEAYHNRAPARRRRLQKELDELRTLVNRSPPNTVDTFAAVADADACIEKIKSYIDDMDRGSLVSEALEVLWNKRFVDILAEAQHVRHWYRVGLRAIPKLRQPVLLPNKDGKLRPHATIYIEDQKSITFLDENRSTGHGNLEGHGDVVCHRLQDNKFSTESLEIFPRLQRRAYVQQLKGLAEIDGQFYVVMQNCSKFDSLNKICIERGLPLELESRVEIALKVAQTVAWYHQSNMVVKVIQDTSIVLQVDEDNREHVTPILTDLEHIRNLYERTSGQRHDCRYEASEYRAKSQRTRYSDIWSLGIVVWQIICKGHPYGIEAYVDSTDTEKVQKIRGDIKNNIDPGEFSADIPASLAAQLRRCWNRSPLLRPEARTVAGWLMDAWLHLLCRRDGLSHTPGAGPSDDELSVADSKALTDATTQAEELVSQHRKKAGGRSTGGRETTSATATAAAATTAPRDKINAPDVEALLSSADKNPKSAFLLGASVWWEALDEGALRLLSGIVVDDLALNDDGYRAELALTFLWKAARGGWTDAYLEMELALSFQSLMFKEKRESLAADNTRVEMALAAGARRA